MKKFYLTYFSCFLVYAIGIVIYFYTTPTSVPPAYQGGPADPATFMSRDQLNLTHRYSLIGYLTYFLEIPLYWLVYLSIMGWSVRARNGIEKITGIFLLQILMYVCLFQFFRLFIHLPVSIAYFILDHRYGLSNETWGIWIGDTLKQFLLNLIIAVPLVWLGYWLIRKSPTRWWLWSWVILAPVIMFMVFVKPILIDPMFNNFYPLQNQELKHEILALAAKAKVPTNEVYEVNMSQQTNVMNAYVSGIGSSARIVIWDNTLKKMKKDEILFIMAHEMGHYVEKHIIWGLGIALVSLFLLLWVLYRLFLLTVGRWGPNWGIRGMTDLAAIPLLFLVYSVVNFAATPIENIVSRVFEHRADSFAMKIYGNVDAGEHAFQKLASDSLQDVNPPWLAQTFLDDHPTLMQRIDFVQHYKKTSDRSLFEE